MCAWHGKKIIGLTGNIATGKSVVLKMLEQLGAFGIDADALAHTAILKGAPAYQPILDTFSTEILREDGEIDRSKLANKVFSNPVALVTLERIVHPVVEKMVDELVTNLNQDVVILEAIKLIESGLINYCDSLWVTDASQEVQISRLIEQRGMSLQVALQRIKAQPPQDEKLARADVIIRNDGSLEDTWQQVISAWQMGS